MVVTVFFIVALFGASYSYFIYPIILLLINKFKPDRLSPVDSDSKSKPCISFIITAFNEENNIANKIENTLAVDYPPDLLEIIIASDGSTDKTNTIVQSYAHKGIILHNVKERKGKENAQKSAISSAKGEILVFSDVSTHIEVCALKQIAERFESTEIGAISSEDRFLTDKGEVAGEGAYVRYEMWLRKLESNVEGLVGLSGSFFAARKEVCQDWNIGVPSDFNTALNCVKNGYTAITAPELLGFYPNLKDETKEYQRKVRTVIRGMAALFSQSFIMNPFKYGLFAFQVISHKLMRWLVPWFLLLTFIFNLLIIDSSWLFNFSFIAQCIFYGVAAIGFIFSKARKNPLVKIIYFFIQVNLAIFQSSLMYMFGKRITFWEPSKR